MTFARDRVYAHRPLVEPGALYAASDYGPTVRLPKAHLPEEPTRLTSHFGSPRSGEHALHAAATVRAKFGTHYVR